MSAQLDGQCRDMHSIIIKFYYLHAAAWTSEFQGGIEGFGGIGGTTRIKNNWLFKIGVSQWLKQFQASHEHIWNIRSTW